MWAATDPDLEKDITGSYEVSVSDNMDMVVSASKEGVVLFPPPIDILGKTNIF